MKKINYKEAIVYEIHPQSFYDTNNDGIGDLQGIIKKLDYLKKLGVNFIWLNPIYLSPKKDNGYDVSDYKKIDPMFGSMTDFNNLVNQAKKRNIYIMMDMIFNHCSTEHEWFLKALTNKKYKNRFIFVDNKNKLPNNWTSKFGGSVWEYNKTLDKYYLHLFDKTQADLNWKNKALRNDIFKIINYWLDKGVKGLRFDVINLISKPKTFKDDLIGDGRKYYTDRPLVHKYIKEMASKTYSLKNDVITVGELSSTSLKQAILYTKKESKELDMVFMFHHLKVDYLNNDKWQIKKYDPKQLVKMIKTQQIAFQKNNAWSANFLNNHDQPRVISRFGDYKNYYYQSATSLASVVLLLRGTPYLYQGEEFGMLNNNYSNINQLKDVESINYYKILKNKGLKKEEILNIISNRSRDNSRTVMQWDDSLYAGFSSHRPWIDVNNNYLDINFKKDYSKSQSIFKAYQKLIRLRKKHLAFSYGDIEFINLNPNVLSFYRTYLNEKYLVIINLSDLKISSNKLNQFLNLKVIFNNYKSFKQIKPYQVVVLKCN
ncbi:alpha,alpha-phosphotrehalase [Mycoplasma sp. 06067-C1-B144P-99-0482-3]|uniref:alpha,alpha-phosphotrehalase n=1 Tax=Mycoplasma sp. 06067-C1-B144P-99-0482-3 TaxID=3117438 RepID=UPI003DA4F78E